MYILPAYCSESDERQLHDTSQHVTHDISGLVWIDNSIKEGSIDENTHVILGVDGLLGHVDYSCFEGDGSDPLDEGRIVVKSWSKGLFKLAKTFHEANIRGLYFFKGAAQAATAVTQARDILFIGTHFGLTHDGRNIIVINSL